VRPEVRPLGALAGLALTVDVEEWYHSCWVPEYVDPARRPPLVEELDRLLPACLELLAELGATATFFVLGEVARRHPRRVREIADAGHEVACHGFLHRRADDRPVRDFCEDVGRARAILQEVTGRAVRGFRAPEWSLRHLGNPRLRAVAELGFEYDSSLSPSVGAGDPANPREPCRLVWSDGLDLLEAPPLVWGGALRLPVGGWTGRLAPERLLERALDEAAGPTLVVHPWELVDRPVPGLYTGFARFFHDAGRVGFRERFDRLVRSRRARPLGDLLARLPAAGADLPDTENALGTGAPVAALRTRPAEGR
jgi:peptidoglycan/xylan/chitin deacetylase (PgdA/CDA1 family)